MIIQSREQKQTPRGGFTLMEVLVVVAILVILAGVGVAVFRYLGDSQEKIAKMQIMNLEKAVMAYKLNANNGALPTSLQELTVAEPGKAAYLEEKDLVDPWGHPYQYDPNTLSKTQKPKISSQGAQPGTSQPISNW